MNVRPGGVAVRPAGEVPQEALVLARRFGAALDQSGTVGTRYRITLGCIFKATKLSSGACTNVTVVPVPGQWVFGAYTRAASEADQYDPRSWFFSYEEDQCPLIHGAAWDFPADAPRRLPKKWEEDENYLFDKAKLKYFGVTAAFASPPQDYVERLRYRTALSVCKHHLVSVETVSLQRGNGISYGGLDIHIIAPGAPTRHAFPEEADVEEPNGLPVNRATVSRVVIQPDDVRTLFDGARNFGRAYYHRGDSSIAIQGGLSLRPTYGFILYNKITGGYTDLAVVSPLQWFDAQADNALNRMAKNGEMFGDKVPTDFNGYVVGAEHGHGVALLDLGFSKEDAERISAGENRLPLLSRVRGTSVLKASAYGIRNGFQRHEEYYSEVRKIKLRNDRRAWEIEEGEFVQLTSNATEKNAMLSFGATYRQGEPDIQPQQTPPLLDGEMPKYYGPAQIMVGVSTMRFYCTPHYPNRILLEKEQTLDDPAPEFSVFMHVDTSLFVYDVSEGVSSGRRIPLQTNDLFLMQEHVPIDDEANTVKWPKIVPRYYFYAASGAALPAVIVPVSASRPLPPQPEPPRDAPDDFSYYNSKPSFGQQDGAAKFVLFYFQGNAGYKKVEFDLGGYEPPRPTMYGLNLFGAFGANLLGTTQSQFWYNRNKLTPNDTYDGHTHVVTSKDGTTPMELAHRLSMSHYRMDHIQSYSDYPTKGPFRPPDGEEPAPENAWYQFTQRRDSRCRTEGQRIHAHMGQGRVAILATNDASPSTPWVSWTLVVAAEATGEFIEARGKIPCKDERGYPLESSGWINLNLISREIRNADGDVTSPAVFVVSVTRPTSHTYDQQNAETQGLATVATGRRDPEVLEGYFHNLLRDNSGGNREILKGVWVRPEDNIDYGCEKYISYDGGVTWTPFVEQIPGDVYYLGNALQRPQFIP